MSSRQRGGWVRQIWSANGAGSVCSATPAPSDPSGALDPVDSITDGAFSTDPAILASDNLYADQIGWANPSVVDYYRTIEAAPCYMRVWQQMLIDCVDGASQQNAPYQLHDIWLFIDPEEFVIFRDGGVAVSNY